MSLAYGDVEWLSDDSGAMTVTHGLKIFHVEFSIVGAGDDQEIEAFSVDSDEEPEDYEVEDVHQFVSSIPYSRLISLNPFRRIAKDESHEVPQKKFYLYVSDDITLGKVEISETSNASLGVLLFVGAEKNVSTMARYIKGLYVHARKYKFNDAEITSAIKNVTSLLSDYTHNYPSQEDDARLERVVIWWSEVRDRRSLLENYYQITTAFLNEVVMMNRSHDLVFVKVDEASRFDVASFRNDYPDLYERYKKSVKRESLSTTKPVPQLDRKEPQTSIYASFVEANRAAKQLTIEGEKVLVKRVDGGFSVTQRA